MKWVLVLFLVCCVVAKHEVYDGYSVYKVIVKDLTQIELLHKVVNQVIGDVLSQSLLNRPGQVLVAKDKKHQFQELLNDAGLEYVVEVENIKELLDLEDKLLDEAKSRSSNDSQSSTHLCFDRIYTYEEVDEYIEYLAATYPNVVSLALGGYSFEERPIKYLKISTTNFQDHNKPVVFIESLIHAREWITLPATLYAIEKLIIDIQEPDLLLDIDWIILPIANPDGYVFTHGENRLWRKNRATGYTIANVCSGVDLNRNFNVDWSTYSSNLVCSETFHGSGPFSEPEAVVIRNIMLEHSDRMELFLDIHSFGSYILYGYGSGTLPPNGVSLNLLGVNMAAAIDRVKMPWNPDYTVGNTASELYYVSGAAPDYAQSMGVPFSYTYELPGHRYGTGSFGFFVDPSFIEQAGFETWEGIKVGARYARDSYRLRNI